MNASASSQEIRISGDSHLSEPPDLWEKNLPIKYRDRAPRFPRVQLGKALHSRPGGWDPIERLKDMAMDGISAELLFPTLAKGIYDQADDPDLAAACDQTYNDWLIEYCQEAPDRLWGQAFIGLWNMDYAVKELERTRNAGLKAATIWVIPPDELSFTSDHYERFWSASEDLDMPISMHINTGFGLYAEGSEARPEGGQGANPIASAARRAFGHKAAVAQSVTEMILSGVFERHPRLKLIIAEFGVGWIPYWLEDLDRKSAGAQRALPLKPSEYFNRQVFATFEQDGVGGYLLERWGSDNFMWANDYPHGGGIWPYSDDTIALTLGHLEPDIRRKVLGENMARVFGLPMPEPMPRLPIPDNAEAIWSRPWLKRVGEYTFDKHVMGL
jgi:predicted TIM-barrel fold metal-dependent hydrolase